MWILVTYTFTRILRNTVIYCFRKVVMYIHFRLNWYSDLKWNYNFIFICFKCKASPVLIKLVYFWAWKMIQKPVIPLLWPFEIHSCNCRCPAAINSPTWSAHIAWKLNKRTMAGDPLSRVLAKSATNGHSKDTQSYLVAAFKRQQAAERDDEKEEATERKSWQQSCMFGAAGSMQMFRGT